NESQPYPGDVQPAPPLDATQTQSVSRGVLEPVTAQPLPPPIAAGAPAPAAPSPRQADAPLAPTVQPLGGAVLADDSAKQDRIARAEPAVASDWSKVGGTMVTVKEGQTLSGLADRYNVPAAVIME